VLSVVFSPAARAELIEAQDWYGARDAELTACFTAEVETVVERIAAVPQQFLLSTETSTALGTDAFRPRCSFGQGPDCARDRLL
jgi:plasmid stabilization system protein ParE